MLKIESGKYYKHYDGSKIFVAFNLHTLRTMQLSLFTNGFSIELDKDIQNVLEKHLLNNDGEFSRISLICYKLRIICIDNSIDNWGWDIRGYAYEDKCRFVSEWTEEDEKKLQSKFCNSSNEPQFLVEEKKYEKYEINN